MNSHLEGFIVICFYIFIGYLCGRMHQFGIMKEKEKDVNVLETETGGEQ